MSVGIFKNYSIDNGGFIAKDYFKDGITFRGNKIVEIDGREIIYSKMGQGKTAWVVIPGYIVEKVHEKLFRVQIIETLEEKVNILKALKQKHLQYRNVYFWIPTPDLPGFDNEVDWKEYDLYEYKDKYDLTECLDYLNIKL